MDVEIKKLVEWARSRKNAALRDKGPSADIPPQMDLWRDGEFIAALILVGEQSKCYEVMQMAIIGYAADRVRMIQDSYHSTIPAEHRGSLPSFEAMFHSPDPSLRAMISEALIVAELNRDGTRVMVTAPYVYDPKKQKFRWKPVEDFDGMGGALVDVVTDAFSSPAEHAADFITENVILPDDLSPQIASDILITRMLAKHGAGAVMYAAKDARTSELLERSPG